MGERNPTFPNVQFLDSSESDEKSARLSGGKGVPLSVFDFVKTSTCASCIPIDIGPYG